MNWDYTGTKSYVDVVHPTVIYHPNPAYDRPPYWPTPQADARLKSGVLRQPCSSEHLRGSVQQFGPLPSYLASQQQNPVSSSQRAPLSRTASLPPVEPSKQLASTPNLHQGAPSPTSSHNTPALGQSAFTPPVTATVPGQHSALLSTHPNMADPRRNQGQQRPLMGPPETPSRVMQASPNMFSTLQFSPDLYSTQSMGPSTAPMYPQQRLFWDQSMQHPEHHQLDHFHTPYQDNFDTSFHSSSTVVPHYSPIVPQSPVFDLPQQQQLPHGPFLDTSGFPMPFQTSPRPPPPAIENPTQFLSSPARRFGGSDVPVTSSFGRPAREVPAYHHQIEESRRERELEKRRNKSAAKRADADLIMSSVKRALSPSKSVRPGIKRSQTHSGVSVGQQQLRRTSRVSFNDSNSASSIASGESSRNDRASPVKTVRRVSSLSMFKTRLSQKSRTAMSLAIDENGVAKTVLQQLPESEDDMDVDDDSQSVLSSTDEEDFSMILSQTTSFVAEEDDTSSRFSQASANASLPARDVGRSRGTTRLVQDYRGSVLPSGSRSSRRAASHNATKNTVIAGKGDAQKALRAIIEDRSRSVSAQGGYSSSRQSDSSVQFHSSPPVQQGQFGDFNPSPTTVTDPDLATPSTDQESYGLGVTRCVCNSMSPDGSAMVQCDSCSKWLHLNCIGLDKRQLADSYVCVYCEQTPVRHPRSRGSTQSSIRGTGNSASPLAHKSVRPKRGR